MNQTFDISVDLLQYSINPDGKKIATIAATYPRFIHPQVLTYRMFSRGSSSSRAIPTPRLIKRTKEENVSPLFWGGE